MLHEIIVEPVVPGDLAAIAALHGRVFGPGRYARSAYRVREGTAAISRFCLKARRGGGLVAALRLTDVAIGRDAGALLLGPLAVEPQYAGLGHGRGLVASVLGNARIAGVRLVVLVGDESYYRRFGFVRVPPGQVRFPGPVAPDRVLAAELETGALAAYAGLVTGVSAGSNRGHPKLDGHDAAMANAGHGPAP